MKVEVNEATRKVLERSYSPGSNFIKLETRSLGFLVEHLSREGMRLLGLMLNHLKWENKIHLTQKEMADTLRITPQNLHRALRELVEECVIYEGKPIIGESCYIFNPDIGYMGDDNERLKLAQKLDHVNLSTGELPKNMGFAEIDGMLVDKSTGEVVDGRG